MNIAIRPTNFWPSWPPSQDHWASARTEARSLINIGFGLSVMGHNVDLQNEQLKDAPLIWGNVSLLKNWNTSKHYDRVILFNPPSLIPGENYEKILYIHYGPTPDAATQAPILAKYPKTKALFYIGAPEETMDLVHALIKDAIVPVDSFPCLFPIPAYNSIESPGFREPTLKSGTIDVKILIMLSTWMPTSGPGLWKVLEILRTLRDKLKLKITLTLIINNVSELNQGYASEIYKEFGALYILNASIDYKGILDVFSSADVCITSTSGHNPMGGFDAVSLGKLVIPIQQDNQHSWQYLLDGLRGKFLIVSTEDAAETERKLSLIFDDPESYIRFTQEKISAYNYPNWKIKMEEILSKY